MPLQPLDFGALHKAVGRWAELNISRNEMAKQQAKIDEEKEAAPCAESLGGLGRRQ